MLDVLCGRCLALALALALSVSLPASAAEWDAFREIPGRASYLAGSGLTVGGVALEVAALPVMTDGSSMGALVGTSMFSLGGMSTVVGSSLMLGGAGWTRRALLAEGIEVAPVAGRVGWGLVAATPVAFAAALVLEQKWPEYSLPMVLVVAAFPLGAAVAALTQEARNRRAWRGSQEGSATSTTLPVTAIQIGASF